MPEDRKVVNDANQLGNSLREDSSEARCEAIELTTAPLRAGTDVVAQATLGGFSRSR